MTFPLRNTICNFPKIPVKTISAYRQPENGRKIPNSSALLVKELFQIVLLQVFDPGISLTHIYCMLTSRIDFQVIND